MLFVTFTAENGEEPKVHMSGADWLSCLISLLRGLMKMHDKSVIMIDIKDDNVICHRDAKGLWHLQFIDMGCAIYNSNSYRYAGFIISLRLDSYCHNKARLYFHNSAVIIHESGPVLLLETSSSLL